MPSVCASAACLLHLGDGRHRWRGERSRSAPRPARTRATTLEQPPPGKLLWPVWWWWWYVCWHEHMRGSLTVYMCALNRGRGARARVLWCPWKWDCIPA
jgi:hypothetical protein